MLRDLPAARPLPSPRERKAHSLRCPWVGQEGRPAEPRKQHDGRIGKRATIVDSSDQSVGSRP